MFIPFSSLKLRYNDVPDATEEDIEQYPRVLATFFQQGFPYMNGLRKLMECPVTKTVRRMRNIIDIS